MEPPRMSLFGRNPKAFSQGSKTTSTPQTNNSPNVSLSPSISDISASAPVAMEVDDDSSNTSNDESALLSDSMIKDVEDEDSFDESVINASGTTVARRVKTIKWTGFWSSLKPKNKDSLYFKIMCQFSELECIVIDFCNLYQKNPKEAIIFVLQFFVDICGYKKLQVWKYYNFEKGNAKNIIEMMETELIEPELKKTGKFLFMKLSKFEIVIEKNVASFINSLIIMSSRTEILYDGVFLGHLLEFVNCMSFSNIRAIRVTGVIIALKLLTAFVNLYSEFLIYLEKNAMDENQNSLIEKLDEKKTTIENCMDFLYMIYDRNCLIHDKKCFMIRAMCAQEIFEWIQLFPHIFIIKRRGFGRLMKLILDSSEVVRMKALITCEKIIKSDSDQLHEELKNRIELCLKCVSTRFIDANYKISVKALSVFTEAIDRYLKYIVKDYKVSIVQKIFHKNFPLAAAAGKFIVTYFRKKFGDEEQVLLSLSKVIFMRIEFAQRISFFIEACIEFTEEIRNWDLIVNLILEDEVNSKKQLLEILKESTKYALTGKCLYSRTMQEKNQTPEDHITVATAIIPRFEELIGVFQNDKKCLIQLVEILSFINYDYLRAENLEKYYTEILNMLKQLFQVTTDKAIIENICGVFSRFTEKQAYNRANVILEAIKKAYVSTLTDDLKQLTPEFNKELLIRLREKSVKTSILFSHFDLTNILKWEDIFEVWDSSYFKALKYLIVCCKWYLVWDLRHLVGQVENNGTNHLLYNNCKDFVYSCLRMLKDADNSSESFLIFESFCDFYTILGKELRRKRQFDNFIIKISEPAAHDVLFNFLTRHVIESTNLPLLQRQKYLNKVINVIFLEAVPIECLSRILRFYHSHCTEFGTIINNVLIQLYLAVPALSLLIIHTLTEIYEQILEKRKMVNISNDESNVLKLLAKKFASARVLKSSNDALKLVNMAIYFSFYNEKNYVFLYFAKYFVKLLNEDAKSEAYTLFTQLVPDKEKNNDIILLFANSLKPRV